VTTPVEHQPRGNCSYVGGPLAGTPVQAMDNLTRFRGDDGQPLPCATGAAQLAGGRTRSYYWTRPGPGRSGVTYVHLSRLDRDGNLKPSQ
jgi:hypothetical protein